MNEKSQGKAHRALELPTTVDISPLSYFLYCQGIPHKVTEQSGKQVVWAVGQEQAAQIEQYYRDWQYGLLTLQEVPERKTETLTEMAGKIAWRRYPVTLLFLCVSVLIGVVSGFGDSWGLVRALAFTPFDLVSDGRGGAELHFYTLSVVLEKAQYWRLFTPVFLHFSVVHLAFNMLWLFDLGKRIEAKQGGIHVGFLIIATGIASNVVQYIWGGDAAIFGGFSGVVFGLLGYCMMREKVDKSCHFGILPAIYGFMLAYLAIGYSGVLDGLFGGSIANAAHTGGLLSGVLAGALAGMFFRKPLSMH